MIRLLQNPRLLLPFMVVLGMMILGLRIGDVWDAASSGHLFAREALAQGKTDAPPAISPPSLAAAPAPAAAPSPPPVASEPETAKPSVADTPAADEDVSPAE